MTFTTNNTLAVKPYQQGQGLQGEVKNGFAFVKQKTELVGLELIADARVVESGNALMVPKGSTIYINEEYLTTQSWAKQSKKCPALGDQLFILVELKYVSLIDTGTVL